MTEPNDELVRWICSSCGSRKGIEKHQPECDYRIFSGNCDVCGKPVYGGISSCMTCDSNKQMCALCMVEHKKVCPNTRKPISGEEFLQWLLEKKV